MPSVLSGEVNAPPSKSMAHRLLLLAALSGGKCKVKNIAYSEDVMAMTDCITALGAECKRLDGCVEVDGSGFLKDPGESLNCRESGNTLRFLIPLCLTLGKKITLSGSKRLMERPQEVYENLCAERGFIYERSERGVAVCGGLACGDYTVDGSVSSQFISGLIFALLSLDGVSRIHITPPVESRPYIDLTLKAISDFGGKAVMRGNTVEVTGGSLSPRDVCVEGDYSNAAFLDAFNLIGGSVKTGGLDPMSAQGDKVYKTHFAALCSGAPEIDISDCPDLGPILIALAALKNGCRLTGTRRLAIKESDRTEAMKREMLKFGCKLDTADNSITIPKVDLKRPEEPLDGHNDHRIVMSMAVICSVTGGEIAGCEAVRKTYPDFFEVTERLGLRVRLDGEKL